MHYPTVLSQDYALPPQQRLADAEDLRQTKKYLKALELVSSIDSLTKEQVSALDDDQFVRYLTALRLCFGCVFSLAKRAVPPAQVVRYWKAAGEYISRYSFVLFEEERISSFKRGVRGEQYDFETEMLRDLVRFLYSFMELTGKARISSNLGDWLMSLAKNPTHSTSKYLLLFESRLMYFQSHQSPSNFNELFTAWRVAYRVYFDSGSYERAMTITGRIYVCAPEDIKPEIKKAAQGLIAKDNKLAMTWKEETSFVKRVLGRYLKYYQRIIFWITRLSAEKIVPE